MITNERATATTNIYSGKESNQYIECIAMKNINSLPLKLRKNVFDFELVQRGRRPLIKHKYVKR